MFFSAALNVAAASLWLPRNSLGVGVVVVVAPVVVASAEQIKLINFSLSPDLPASPDDADDADDDESS